MIGTECWRFRPGAAKRQHSRTLQKRNKCSTWIDRHKLSVAYYWRNVRRDYRKVNMLFRAKKANLLKGGDAKP